MKQLLTTRTTRKRNTIAPLTIASGGYQNAPTPQTTAIAIQHQEMMSRYVGAVCSKGRLIVM